MQLKLSANPRFKATVTAVEPTLEGPSEVSFDVRFRALRLSELEAYGTDAEGNERFLRDVLLGAEVFDDEGAMVPWSDEVRDRLIDTPWLRGPMLLAYRRAIAGAARGN